MKVFSWSYFISSWYLSISKLIKGSSISISLAVFSFNVRSLFKSLYGSSIIYFVSFFYFYWNKGLVFKINLWFDSSVLKMIDSDSTPEKSVWSMFTDSYNIVFFLAFVSECIIFSYSFKTSSVFTWFSFIIGVEIYGVSFGATI